MQHCWDSFGPLWPMRVLILLWDQWRTPLLELLDTPEGGDLCASVPFQRLLQPWFNDHTPTDQQDAAEFLGWLRGHHLHSHV